MWRNEVLFLQRCDPKYNRTTITVRRKSDAQRVAQNAKALRVVQLSARVFYPQGDSESAAQRIEKFLGQ